MCDELQFEKLFNSLDFLLKNCESFLTLQDTVNTNVKNQTKELYDTIKSREKSQDNNTLSELIIKGFDDEQIWQEIELQNNSTFNQLISSTAKSISCDKLSLKPKTHDSNKLHKKHISNKQNRFSSSNTLVSKIHNKSINLEDIDSESEHSDEPLDRLDSLPVVPSAEESLSDEEMELEKLLDEVTSSKVKSKLHAVENSDNESSEYDESDEPDDSDTNFDFSISSANISNFGQNNKIKSVTDDNFFKKSEMEAFLDQEDAKEMKKKDQEQDNSQEFDFFSSLPSDEESGEPLNYKDFFGPPDSESKQLPSLLRPNESKNTLVSNEANNPKEGFCEPRSKADLLSSDSEGEDINDILKNSQKLSDFEKRQNRLQDKIKSMEDESLKPKAWQLQGEVSSSQRPVNSILEEYLEHEHTTRLPPIITQESTKSLEDIIKIRIKDKTWDDVERKVKPSEMPFEFKKNIVLDQEKSKQSLVNIYEQEYIKQSQKIKENESNPMHKEIQSSMSALFIKLDALSNFHFTPKKLSSEIKIVSNMPTINIEEVAPVNVNDSALMAPEEIHRPTNELKSNEEKSASDKRKSRRKSKRVTKRFQTLKKEKEKMKEKLKLKPGKKEVFNKAIDSVDKLVRTQGNISYAKKSSVKNSLTSSNQFFTQLQNEVNSNKSKKVKLSDDKSKRLKTSEKYKL